MRSRCASRLLARPTAPRARNEQRLSSPSPISRLPGSRGLRSTPSIPSRSRFHSFSTRSGFWTLSASAAFVVCAVLVLATGELMGLSSRRARHSGTGCPRSSAGSGLRSPLPGLAWTLVCLKVIVPAFRGEESPFYDRFASVGGSPGGMVKTALHGSGSDRLGPLHRALTSPMSCFLAVPLAGAFLLSPALAAVAIPQLLVNGLSDWSATTDPRHHYVAAVLPFLLRRHGPRRRPPAGRSPYSRRGGDPRPVLVLRRRLRAVAGRAGRESGRFHPTLPRTHVDALRAAVAFVPDGAPVTATNGVGSQLSGRRYFYSVPVVAPRTEWILLDTWNTWMPPSEIAHGGRASRASPRVPRANPASPRLAAGVRTRRRLRVRAGRARMKGALPAFERRSRSCSSAFFPRTRSTSSSPMQPATGSTRRSPTSRTRSIPAAKAILRGGEPVSRTRRSAARRRDGVRLPAARPRSPAFPSPRFPCKRPGSSSWRCSSCAWPATLWAARSPRLALLRAGLLWPPVLSGDPDRERDASCSRSGRRSSGGSATTAGRGRDVSAYPRGEALLWPLVLWLGFTRRCRAARVDGRGRRSCVAPRVLGGDRLRGHRRVPGARFARLASRGGSGLTVYALASTSARRHSRELLWIGARGGDARRDRRPRPPRRRAPRVRRRGGGRAGVLADRLAALLRLAPGRRRRRRAAPRPAGSSPSRCGAPSGTPTGRRCRPRSRSPRRR